MLIRYSLLPIVFTFTMGSPTNFAMGKLLDEKYKPAYCDSLTGMGHPFTGLFPHTNPAELFVFLGVAQGITKLRDYGISCTLFAGWNSVGLMQGYYYRKGI